MRTIRLLAAGLLSAAVLGGAGAGTAPAHTPVESTRPSSGSSASTSVTRVTVTFSGQIRRGTLKVTGPDGRVVSRGAGGVDPRNVTRLLAGLRSNLSAGRYKASWTMVAADGHNQRGSFSFRLKR
jgi:methionine-rich copper-binding protein CopC